MTPGCERVAAIVQARMGSTRLPGKVMRELGGLPVLDWVTQRVGMAHSVDEVVVATSTHPDDDLIAEHLAIQGITVVRGSEHDVLARYGDALAHTDATRIVRITADCPFVQPALIDLAVSQCEPFDYVCTALDGRFPRGFDLEVVRRSALEEAVRESTHPEEREHVMPFIYRRPQRFAVTSFEPPRWARRPDLRLTLDEPADMQLMTCVVDSLQVTPRTLTGEQLVEFLDAHPDVASINQTVEHRNID
jgi:spore coat polysaccharide biosynthesis protein SpsF